MDQDQLRLEAARIATSRYAQDPSRDWKAYATEVYEFLSGGQRAENVQRRAYRDEAPNHSRHFNHTHASPPRSPLDDARSTWARATESSPSSPSVEEAQMAQLIGALKEKVERHVRQQPQRALAMSALDKLEGWLK